MYRPSNRKMVIENCIGHFEGKLSADNRWIKLAELIPWAEIEKMGCGASNELIRISCVAN